MQRPRLTTPPFMQIQNYSALSLLHHQHTRSLSQAFVWMRCPAEKFPQEPMGGRAWRSRICGATGGQASDRLQSIPALSSVTTVVANCIFKGSLGRWSRVVVCFVACRTQCCPRAHLKNHDETHPDTCLGLLCSSSARRKVIVYIYTYYIRAILHRHQSLLGPSTIDLLPRMTAPRKVLPKERDHDETFSY